MKDKLDKEGFITSFVVSMSLIAGIAMGYMFRRLEVDFVFDIFIVLAIPVLMTLNYYQNLERGDNK